MIKSADLHRSCSGRMINSYFHKLINFSCQFVFVFINSSSYYFTVFNRVKSNPGLHWFCLTLLSDWSSKLAPLPQPIRCKPTSITTWSPALSRALGGIFLSAHWLLQLVQFWSYRTQSKSARSSSTCKLKCNDLKY